MKKKRIKWAFAWIQNDIRIYVFNHQQFKINSVLCFSCWFAKQKQQIKRTRDKCNMGKCLCWKEKDSVS